MKGLSVEIERLHDLIVDFTTRLVGVRIQFRLHLAAASSSGVRNTLYNRFECFQRSASPINTDGTE